MGDFSDPGNLTPARATSTERIVRWSGLLRIDHDTVIPRGTLVIVEPGTRILLDNAILRVDGELKASDAAITGGYGERSLLAFAPGSRGILQNVLIQECAHGIAADSSGLWLDDCLITGNTGFGLQISNTRLAIRGGTLSRNGLHGLYADGQSVILLERSRIVENSLDGARVIVGIEMTAIDCDFSHNRGAGLKADSLARLNLQQCRISRNRGPGLDVATSGSVHFADGIISGNQAGCILVENREARIERSDILFSQNDNITVIGGSCSLDGSSRVENAGGCGLQVFADAVVLLEYGVAIQFNRSHGVVVKEARIMLKGTLVRSNGGSGIRVEAKGKVELNTGCQVQGNEGNGIEVDGGEALLITADVIDNRGRGIESADTSTVYVDPHCRFYSNGLPNRYPGSPPQAR